MTSVLESLGDIALSPDVITGLQTNLTGLAGRVPGLPTADIQQIAGLAGQISAARPAGSLRRWYHAAYHAGQQRLAVAR